MGSHRCHRPRWASLVLSSAVSLLVLTASPASLHGQSPICPAEAIHVRPTDALQMLVDANPAGTAFCLQSGTYTRISIVPKDGQQFIGNGTSSQIVFNGAGDTPIAFNGVLDANNPSANREDVTLKNITFMNYRTQEPFAQAVLIPDSGWTIENVVIRDSTSGIRGGNVNWTCANNFVLRDTLIEDISHAALYWNATNGLTERVTVRNSGFGLSDQDADFMGVVKYQNQGMYAGGGNWSDFIECPIDADQSLIVQDSTFENLNGVGLWCDIHCQNFVARRNMIRDNQWSGIMWEISGGGVNVIEDNILMCNRRGARYPNGGWGGGEIFITNAFGIQVRNNDITVCDGGRAFSFVFHSDRAVPTRDITLEGNTVRMLSTPVYTFLGNAQRNQIIVTDLENGSSNLNIVFRSNVYFVPDVTADYFHWDFRSDWAAWKSLSQDTSTFLPLSDFTALRTRRSNSAPSHDILTEFGQGGIGSLHGPIAYSEFLNHRPYRSREEHPR